ncbi:mucin-associated surface protein (MASP) [Trypanosoma cruzi Dm28c]|uniref:Mucin-associated surface protein (MASP) n=2 Tax=Trypanosoma cruzi TaxID=5693 RepID=V5B6P5_TRYCR|nr:mucin-associated surface protein (MASP) [Trypanosoma cruzi Dm28c]PBJ76345.1 mucin-associated surface protein [Trypanosoma cruzi cruzi]PWU97470.1 Mucin-associated surface protein (MASP) [Trypanosoma cruzi]
MVLMMMTGRVLLVCALCVLWCGAAAVVSSAPDATRPENVWPDYLFLNWHELFRNECKVENPYDSNEDLKGLAVNCCVRDAMRELCSSFYGKTVMENKDPKVEGICKNYAGKPDDVADCPKPKTNLSPAAVTPVKVSDPEAQKEKEEALRKTPEEAPKAPPGTTLTNSAANPTNVSPSPPLKGQPANEEEVPVPNSEEGSVNTEPTNDSEEGDTDTVTDTEPDEPSNSQAEPNTPTPTAASDNGDNETDKGTGEDTPNNAPEPDVAGTEEKQDKNKNNKPKERPVEVAGIKTATVTSGDSDGSTAVSHSTSPLLLLLVFACAAAAAVVAA